MFDDFICKTCLCVAYNPVQCNTCQSLFCGKCLKMWKKHNQKCPGGCGSIFIEKKLDKIVKNQLSNFKFQCPADKGCGQIFNYDNASKHKQCQDLTGATCLLECGDKKLFRGEIEMRDHFMTICPKQRGRCVKCQVPLIRSDVLGHECKETPAQTIYNLKADNNQLKTDNNQLRAENNQLKTEKNN